MRLSARSIVALMGLAPVLIAGNSGSPAWRPPPEPLGEQVIDSGSRIEADEVHHL